MRLLFFSFFALVVTHPAIMKAQTEVSPLKELWLTQVGTDEAFQLGTRVVTNSQGNAIFAGTGLCNTVATESGIPCQATIGNGYILLDDLASIDDSQILGDLSPDGTALGLPFWMNTCDVSGVDFDDNGIEPNIAGEDVVVTDDDMVYLVSTCSRDPLLGNPNEAFLRVFDSALNPFPSADGNTIVLSQPNGTQEEGRAVAIDHVPGDGNDLIYVVGPVDISSNSYIARYEQGAGGFAETLVFGTSDNEATDADDVFVDANGDIYVAGNTFGDFGPGANIDDGSDIFVIKFNSSLEELWRRQIDIDVSQMGGFLDVNAIVVDSNGMVFVGGAIDNSNTNFSAFPFLVKLDPSDLSEPPFFGNLGDISFFHDESFIEDLAVNSQDNILAVARTDKSPLDDVFEPCAGILQFDNQATGFSFSWVHEIEDTSGYGLHIDSTTKDILACGREVGGDIFVARFGLLGDVNCDGSVDLLDTSFFIDKTLTGTFCPKADINCDGAVNLVDVAPFVQLVLANN